MVAHIKHFLQHIFRDKNGAVVLWQWPNIPLLGWIVCVIVGFVVPTGIIKSGFASLGTASLFLWAYLELAQGVTLFRRILGGVVLLFIVAGFFHLV